MATGDQQQRPHLFPQDTRSVEGYTAKQTGGGDKIVVPPKDRQQHASALRAQLAQVTVAQQQRVAEQKEAGVQSAIGIQVEFESEQGVAMAAASLARDHRGIELMNVRQQGTQILATVFVPQGKLDHFEKLITEYVDHKTNKNGTLLDHQTLVDAISALRVATFDSLWTDEAAALPADPTQAIWWEAWLSLGTHAERTLADFRKVADMAGLRVSDRVLHFPERMVAQVYGAKNQFLQSSLVLNMIAELRRAKTTAEFFANLALDEQDAWQADLQQRLQPEPSGNAYVTLLDTGVNHGHPLLAPFVADEDRHAVEPDWGPDDANGHGSELAGLALMGDLTAALAEDAPLLVPHRLESVKVLRFPGDNEGESFGAITAEAVARVEITNTERRRVFAMAVSSTDGRDRGRPSSWSAQVDRLACDYEEQGATRRLFVLCAGNTNDNAAWAAYPHSLSTSSVHDPGQAWNALTVGAYSDLTTISADAPAYTAVASVGGLSPYTTTSATWQPEWPFKPDIVMEGGNVAIEPSGFTSSMDSLSLLTTGHQPHERLFTLSWATSAATALAAGMCARITAAYQSHALRFAVRRPLETEAAFRGRINAQAAAGEQGLPSGGGADPGWTVGEKLRTRGSLLSDSWTGTAAQLANRGQLAIFPAMGWWRNRPSHGRFDRAARYSLLISIEAPTAEQDLYALVAAQIGVAAEVPLEIQVP